MSYPPTQPVVAPQATQCLPAQVASRPNVVTLVSCPTASGGLRPGFARLPQQPVQQGNVYPSNIPLGNAQPASVQRPQGQQPYLNTGQPQPGIPASVQAPQGQQSYMTVGQPQIGVSAYYQPVQHAQGPQGAQSPPEQQATTAQLKEAVLQLRKQLCISEQRFQEMGQKQHAMEQKIQEMDQKQRALEQKIQEEPRQDPNALKQEILQVLYQKLNSSRQKDREEFRREHRALEQKLLEKIRQQSRSCNQKTRETLEEVLEELLPTLKKEILEETLQLISQSEQQTEQKLPYLVQQCIGLFSQIVNTSMIQSLQTQKEALVCELTKAQRKIEDLSGADCDSTEITDL
ncbi:hypothetical protein BDV26DRAFT_289544 [Aspergillus bertholletiae]|uniref:Uncharacterized protein n=1 Tax=Aspergillus bertholletiae TaxID=1226010 RepID=A0A5N7BHS0_9EURO|nr:hypothetical protein BDV26DRAFT_289544 [Aspergillus bertholletiae]